MPGSVPAVSYLAARANGAGMMTACAGTGIGIAEARLIENEIARGLISLPDPSPPTKENDMAEGNVAADELRLLIERVERLEEEKKAISDDVKDVYAEAKARGYDTKTMRAIVRLRKMETQARQEAELLLDTYKSALGMDFAETPLGRAAVDRAGADDLVSLAKKIIANGGTVVNGSLVMPLNDAARAAAGVH
jgi:uncharacterized protein (UPF0335 family)